jgi:parallel beta-helix repeat protein
MNTLYVSTDGNDTWSGRLPAPNSERSDGPLATIVGARNRVRHRSQPPAYQNGAWAAQGMAGPVTVVLRGGVYPLKEPITFGSEDSAGIHFTAYPGETPILDGGRKLDGWRTGVVNDRPCWTLELPEVARGEWHFRSLFVNGRRAPRPKLPKSDWFWIEDVPGKGLKAEFHEGSSRFVAKEGDIQNWRNLADVEVVVMHYWNDEHMDIVSFDEKTRLVVCDRTSILRLTDDFQPRFAKYYVQNIFEALTEPGEWYLDRKAGTLYYIPLEGETPETAEIFAPRMTRLLTIAGDADAGRLVHNLRFTGLTFRHTDAPLPPGGWDPSALNPCEGMRSWPNDVNYASAPQAAFNIPGAISLQAARNCSFEECVVELVGWCAIEIGDACHAIRVVGCELRDLGAGGVKIGGSDVDGPRVRRTGNNVVTDNHIHHAGRVFHQAVGVFIMHSYGNVVAHNHIHDLFYSGVSCGWKWGFMESVCRDNHIERNHIHHLGFGHLCDMGGIYTLGVQPGTTIRGNLIHDVKCANYGGWGIYLDEGSSHILVEDNITHDTSNEGFYQHYGRENILRNNIFTAGMSGQVKPGKTIPGWRGITFQNNIVVSEDAALFVPTYGSDLLKPGYMSDHNLLWSTAGAPWSKNGPNEEDKLDMNALRDVRLERHSLVADPLFADFAARDFTLSPDSPAFSLGFNPIDMSNVGPRPQSQRSGL